jgi:hypothetical protein
MLPGWIDYSQISKDIDTTKIWQLSLKVVTTQWSAIHLQKILINNLVVHSTQSLKIPDSGLYAQKVADLKTCQAIVKLLFFLVSEWRRVISVSA